MKQPLLTVEIFQHGAPGIADRDAFGHFVGGQVRRHGRKQHLAAVCQRADPLRPVHGQPDIAFAVHQWLPGVEAHPHPHLDAVRPGVRGHLALRFRGCGDRVTGPRKHDKGSIALRVDDAPAVRFDCVCQHARMIGEQPCIVFTELP